MWEGGEAMDEAGELTTDDAMEHLQVMTDDPHALVDDLKNYGSLFLGDYSPVVFGDKTSVTNHSLPTLEIARSSGGIWVGTSLKSSPIRKPPRRVVRALRRARRGSVRPRGPTPTSCRRRRDCLTDLRSEQSRQRGHPGG